MNSFKTFAGRHVLLVEDDFFIADDLTATLEAATARVVGPVATVAEALALIARTERLDGAILDINLRGEMAYALVDTLRARGVSIVFVSGYDRATIPERYANIPLCQKPVDLGEVARAMFR